MISKQFQESVVAISSSMIESPLALLQMKIKRLIADAIELGQPALGKAPERLDSIDVIATTSELVTAMTDAVVLLVPHIDQAVIPAPPIAENDRLGIHMPSNNVL